jgi:hypothetical protein
MSNWESDLRRCAPGVEVLIHRGSRDERATNFRSSVRRWWRRGDAPPLVCLCNTDMLLKDRELLSGDKLRWECVIVSHSTREPASGPL